MSPMGQKIKSLRQHKKLTLEQLADAIGSTKSYVWELENKPNIRPSAEKVHKLANILDVTEQYLLDDEQKDFQHPTVQDEAFFRKYNQLDPESKKQIQKILKTFDDE